MAHVADVLSAQTDTQTTTNYTGPLAMVTVLFFMWGFLTCLNDVLIPHLKGIFSLSYAQAMLVQSAFFSSYFVFALPAGRLVERIGYKRTMMISLFTMSTGALLFVPAAGAAVFWLFLSALIVLAAGMTMLQVSANPCVVMLGPSLTASSRLNLAQGFNSLGTFLALPFGSWLILTATVRSKGSLAALSAAALHAYQKVEASTVKVPYLGIAVTLFLLALMIRMVKIPAFHDSQPGTSFKGIDVPMRDLLRQRHLVLGVVAIFLYVGAEIAIGSFLVNYLNQPEIGGMAQRTAALYVSLYWAGTMVGRFIGAALLRRLGTPGVLGYFAVASVLLVLTTVVSFGGLAMWSIILVGLFNSVMFPSIFTLGLEGLGPLTGKASGLLIAAIVGGAVIPFAQGVLADRIGIHHAFLLPAACYCYVAYYGFWGSDSSGLRTMKAGNLASDARDCSGVDLSINGRRDRHC